MAAERVPKLLIKWREGVVDLSTAITIHFRSSLENTYYFGQSLKLNTVEPPLSGPRLSGLGIFSKMGVSTAVTMDKGMFILYVHAQTCTAI